MTHSFTITDARVYNVNGEGTPKEAVLNTVYMSEDDCGTFQNNKQITLPVDFSTPVGDLPSLIGKTVKIEIMP